MRSVFIALAALFLSFAGTAYAETVCPAPDAARSSLSIPVEKYREAAIKAGVIVIKDLKAADEKTAVQFNIVQNKLTTMFGPAPFDYNEIVVYATPDGAKFKLVFVLDGCIQNGSSVLGMSQLTVLFDSGI